MTDEDHNLPHAPDSMRLRKACVRKLELHHWDAEQFRRAQGLILQLREIREQLRFLGFSFQDEP